MACRSRLSSLAWSTPRTLTPLWMPLGSRRGRTTRPNRRLPRPGGSCLRTPPCPSPANPDLRQRLVDIHRSYEQTIDTVSADSLIEAGFSDEQARTTVGSFRQYIEENRDEITALQALYERPYRQTAELRRHKGPGRRPGIAAALLDDRTAVGGLPAVGQVKGARLRPADPGRHRVRGALRHRRR